MKKKKTHKKLIVLLTIAVFVFIGVDYFNRNIYTLWNANKITVTSQDKANIDKIQVYEGVAVASINRENDTELFSNLNKYTLLYADQKMQNNLENEYGENDFLIVYNDEYYLSFRHFKTNRNYQHSYRFKVELKNGIPHLYVNIEGANKMKFDHKMLPVADAQEYICNSPIGTQGSIYNMIELVPEK